MYGSFSFIVNDSERSLSSDAMAISGDFVSSTENFRDICSVLLQIFCLIFVVVVLESDPKGYICDLFIIESVFFMYVRSD